MSNTHICISGGGGGMNNVIGVVLGLGFFQQECKANYHTLIHDNDVKHFIPAQELIGIRFRLTRLETKFHAKKLAINLCLMSGCLTHF